MVDYYVYIDTMEQDGSSYNHLLRMTVRGKEYLISATSRKPLGSDGDRVWVTWSELECDSVQVVDQVGAKVILSHIKLCTATEARKSI